MSISSENRKAGPFTGNGIAVSFPFTFKVFAASDLVVVRQLISTGAETTLVLNTDYTVSLNGNQELNPGGSVVLPAALAATFNLTITSSLPNLQPTTLTNAGGFYPTVLNDALDRATILVQQLRERLLRSISYPVSDPTSVATTLPAAAQRANKVLSFDANGAPETAFSASDVQNAQANAAAAAASASAALASEVAAASSASASASSALASSGSATAAAASATAAQNAVSQIQWNDVVYVATSTVIDSTYRGKLIVVDAAAGAVTITLPSIASLSLATPFVIGIKKNDNSGNTVTILPNGSDTINGFASKVISTVDSGTTLIPDLDPAPDQWTGIDFGAVAGNLVQDVFSGNGSQTSFVLSAAPATKNNTQVFISGVYQNKSGYSLSGATITFVVAPPSGTNNIEVISGATLSIGVPADGAVTNVKMANMAQSTVKGRAAGAGSGSPTDLSSSQVRGLIYVPPKITYLRNNTSLATGSNVYTFVLSSGSASAGDVYTNNSQTFTVAGYDAFFGHLPCTGTGAPQASGTLTRVSGTGSATITFSSITYNAIVLQPTTRWIRVRGVAGGGAGARDTGTGGTGGDTWFFANNQSNGIAQAVGGTGGQGNSFGGSGGQGTVFAGYAISSNVIKGGNGTRGQGTANGVPGFGGVSGMGGSGSAGAAQDTTYGCGGTGSTGAAGSGGGGGAGGYFEFVMTEPFLSVYFFTIGAAGTIPAGGAQGGGGLIIVEEYSV